MPFTQTYEVGRKSKTTFVNIPDLSTAKALPSAGSGTAVLFQAEAQALRYRADGTNPTSTVGVLLAAGDSVWFTGDLSKLRFIEVVGGAKLNGHVFR